MPELPEVETIRRQLAEKIVGKKLDGREITAARRRAKLLLIDFSDGASLVFHLKLTGQLIFNAEPGKYTRHVFRFDDGSRLIFNDARKFGWWKKVPSTKNIEDEFGPEALAVTLPVFRALLAKKKRTKIKALLMDQKSIAGIGNIYSDEILFAAGVRPDRPAGSLIEGEARKIYLSIKKILKSAIKHHGSSIKDYLDAFGQKGGYVPYHKVYQKEKCLKCGTSIKKVKMGGRTAHYCPQCQI